MQRSHLTIVLPRRHLHCLIHGNGRHHKILLLLLFLASMALLGTAISLRLILRCLTESQRFKLLFRLTIQDGLILLDGIQSLGWCNLALSLTVSMALGVALRLDQEILHSKILCLLYLFTMLFGFIPALGFLAKTGLAVGMLGRRPLLLVYRLHLVGCTVSARAIW